MAFALPSDHPDEAELPPWVTEGEVPDDAAFEDPDQLQAWMTRRLTDEGVEATMAKLVAARQLVAAEEAKRDAYKEKIDAWFERAAGAARRRAVDLELKLVHELRQRNIEDAEVKTLTVPSGTVYSQGPKKGQEQVVSVTDADALLEWCEVHRPDLVRETVKHDVLVGTVRDFAVVAPGKDDFDWQVQIVDADGQKVINPPGLGVEHKTRSFQVKPTV